MNHNDWDDEIIKQTRLEVTVYFDGGVVMYCQLCHKLHASSKLDVQLIDQ